MNVKGANLLVVRQMRIDRVDGAWACSRVALPVTITERYPRPLPTSTACWAPGRFLQQLVFDRLGRNVVTRTQDNQVLDAPDDAPVPCRVDFALVAGVKPAVAQRPWRFPAAGSSIREKYSGRAR